MTAALDNSFLPTTPPTKYDNRIIIMYPYKQEILSSLRAFLLAWLIIITPLAVYATVIHPLVTPAEVD